MRMIMVVVYIHMELRAADFIPISDVKMVDNVLKGMRMSICR